MVREHTVKGTAGIEIKFEGRTYTTVEDIHYETRYGWDRRIDDCGLICLEAQCTTDDPEIMWGQGDDSADWFPPEAMWSVCVDELDEWIARRDWADNFNGVLICPA